MANGSTVNEESRNILIPIIQKAISKTFTSGDWKVLGYQTNTQDWIVNHARLLRSLEFGDEDYAGCIFSALEMIINRDFSNLELLLHNEKISRWVQINDSSAYSKYISGIIAVPVFRPSEEVTSKIVELALNDVETLIHSSRPSSAVDRIHTAMHGYLKNICDKAGLVYSDRENTTTTQLFKLIRENHPNLANLGPRAQDIEQILKMFSSVLNAMNPIRNKASAAHPNEEILATDEAMLVINAARTILHYLSAKIGI